MKGDGDRVLRSFADLAGPIRARSAPQALYCSLAYPKSTPKAVRIEINSSNKQDPREK